MAEGATPAERTTGGKEAPGIPGVRQAAVARMASNSGSAAGIKGSYNPEAGRRLRLEHPEKREAIPRGRSGVYYGGAKQTGRPAGRISYRENRRDYRTV